MELSEYTEALRREIAAVTRFAGEDVARAGQLIADTLDSSIRLTLLDVLAGAAAEITSRLDGTAIELRLSSANPTFAIIHAAPAELSPPVPASPPGPPGGAEEESGTARVTLRLPDTLKARAEVAAARDEVSLNTWLVRAVHRALGSPPAPPGPPGLGRRITGFAKS
jgi:HicB family